MKELNWHLKLSALISLLGTIASPVVTSVLSDGSRAVLVGAAIVGLSMILALLLGLKSSSHPRWSIITSGTLMIVAVVISASLMKSPSQWITNMSGWTAGLFFGGLMLGFRGEEKALTMVSFAIFLSIEVVAIGLFVRAIVHK